MVDGVRRPKVSFPIRMAGARAQQPMQRTTSRENEVFRGLAVLDLQVPLHAVQDPGRSL